MTLREALKDNPDIDMDVLLDGELHEYALSWSEDIEITSLGEMVYREVLEAEVVIEDGILKFVGGPVELIADFLQTVAGYVPESVCGSYFIWS